GGAEGSDEGFLGGPALDIDTGAAETAIAAVALLIFQYGLQQVGTREIRPQGTGHVEFGVSDLPEQEVTDGHLAGSTDQQIGIGAGGGIEAGGDQLLIDLQSLNAAVEAGHIEDAIDGVDDLGATAVIDRQVDQEAAVGGGGVDGGIEFAADLFGQGLQAADGLQADIVLLEIGELLFEVVAQQAPEGFHCGSRPLPVLDREGVEGERFDTEAGAGFYSGPHGADAGFVAGHARQQAAGRPAAVAVHDDRDVRRQPAGIDGLRQIPVLVTGLERFE